MSIHGQGPKVMLTAQEMADRLREMVQLKFIDMHTAFRKFDANLDGEQSSRKRVGSFRRA